MSESYKVFIDNSPELEKEFKSKDKLFRIEAVIHDGQYYDVDKWSKISLVETKDIEDYIKNNEDKLMKLNNSYRMPLIQIFNWYGKNNIDITTCIVPSNFTPKIWNGYTEAEFLEKNPRRMVSSLSLDLTNCDIDMINKIKHICLLYGNIVSKNTSEFTVYTLNIDFIRHRISREFGKDIWNNITCRNRTLFKKREIGGLDNVFLHHFMVFYSEYIYGILKNHMTTINTFIPDREDLNVQIIEWILTALSKYDETSGVPFSGYFTTVMAHWPYNLPEIELGRELATFQRSMSRVLKELEDSENTNEISSDMVKERMLDEYSSDDFDRLYSENRYWYNMRNTQDIYYDDNRECKALHVADNRALTQIKPDKDLACSISISLIETAVNTELWDDFFSVLKIIINNGVELNQNLYEELSDDFKEELMKVLAKYRKIVISNEN